VSAPPAVAFAVTPHGFGHAARAGALMLALRRLEPATRIHVFTTVPRWFFRGTLGGGFEHHALEADVGLVQRGPLGEDLPATLARLARLYPLAPAAVAGLALRLRALGCGLLVADIAPLGIAAAAAAGIPSVLVENFTWDWIYRGYAARAPRLASYAGYLARLFRRAGMRIQTEPVCVPAAGAVRVAPVARGPRMPRAAVRRALGAAPRRPLVLVTMGGVPPGRFAVEPLRRLPRVEFVLAGGAPRPRREGNVLLLPHRSPHYHPDLVGAADAVVGKVGYSTLAEVCRAGLPYGFVPRPAFRESAVLGAWLKARGQGVEIGGEELESGAWAARVPELLEIGPLPRCEDGARQAARLLRGLLRG
jgi:hypothetical protein